jgi:L-amino acid N-acyltransferase YncA
MTIRRATLADVPIITQVHIATWQHAYRGIVAQTTLDALDEPASVARRTANWASSVQNSAQFFYVAEDTAGAVVGFAVGGKCRNTQPEFAAYDGEIYALYILPTQQRGGMGRGLVRAIVQDLQGAGYQRLLIWVLRDNHSGRAFYERLGGQFVGELSFEINGQPLIEVGYGWQDFAVFTSSA